jgi:hypothetical protein
VVKDENGEILHESEQVIERWSGYFESLLNVEDDRKVNLTCMGRGGAASRKVVEQTEIESHEVQRAVSKLKNGKAAGEDGITNEMVKSGGLAIVERLVRLFNACMNIGNAPDEWRSAIVVPLFKGKGDKNECKNYIGINLLSTLGKVYGRVLIERVTEITEVLIRDEQGGFRKGRGCVDQVFALKCVCEKYLEKQKEVFVAFMDLEKAYDSVHMMAMWEVL